MVCGAFVVCVPASSQDDADGGSVLGKPSKSGPDLVVSDISWTDCYGTSDGALTSGQPYSISVTVANVGTENVVVQFQTSLYYRDSFIGSQSMDPLPVNTVGVVTWSGLFESEPGSFDFRAVADSSGGLYGDVYETGIRGHDVAESNNERTESMSVVLAKWSFVFFHFGDDAEIEFAMLEEFLWISEVGSSPDISIALLMDRSSGGTTAYGDWTTAKRFFVRPGDTPDPANAIDDIGEVNMGLGSFISDQGQWAFDRFRADKYAVFFHGHGGWQVGTDYDPVPFDHQIPDTLSPAELQDALLAISSSIGGKIDLVAFETCHMARLDPSVYQYRDSCSVLMAFAGVAWTNIPFPYQVTLLDLQANPEMSAEQLASEFLIDLDAIVGTAWSGMAASAVREDRMQTLGTNIDALADLLIDSMPSVKPQIQNAKSVTRCYDDDPYEPNDYVDVIDFATRMKEATTDSAIQSACQDIIDTASGSIVYSIVGSHYEGLQPIAMYWPATSVYVNSPITEWAYWQREKQTDYGINTNWFEFLGGYYDETAPTINSVSINSGDATTTTLEVTISVSASDTQSGLYKMCFSDDGVTWGAWVPYASSCAYTMASGPWGTRTVYCKVKDYGGLESASMCDTIEYVEPPTITIISPNGGENWQAGSTHVITWTSSSISSGGVGIYLCWDVAGYLEIVLATENDGSFSWTVPSDLSTRTDYMIWVQGSDPAYQDIYDSSDGYFTIEEPIHAPTAPTNLAASMDGSAVKLTWTRPADTGGELQGYNIFRWQKGGYLQVVGAAYGDVTTFTDITASPGKTYYYKIDAYNSAGLSPYSNETSIRVPRA